VKLRSAASAMRASSHLLEPPEKRPATITGSAGAPVGDILSRASRNLSSCFGLAQRARERRAFVEKPDAWKTSRSSDDRKERAAADSALSGREGQRRRDHSPHSPAPRHLYRRVGGSRSIGAASRLCAICALKRAVHRQCRAGRRAAWAIVNSQCRADIQP